ncbi:MAG: ABC transporter permease [Candidatus Odinarchaeia archaeon]
MRKILIDSALIAKKELIQLWRDKASLFFTFLIPIAIMAAFTVATPKIQSEVTLTIGVYDADNTSLSNNLIQTLNSSNLNILYVADSRQELQNMIEKGEIAAAIVIPSGFTESVENGTYINLIAIMDNSKQQIKDVLLSNMQDLSDEILNTLKDHMRSIVSENISELHDTLYDFRDNVSDAAFIVYGVPAIYIWGNSSAGVEGWEQKYQTYKTQVETGLLTIYEVNGYANKSTYLFLQQALVNRTTEEQNWILGYHQTFYVNWNATFPNSNPSYEEVYSVTPRYRGEDVISNVAPTYFNSTLTGEEREFFYQIFLNFSLSTWNDSNAIDTFVLQTFYQNESLSKDLVAKVYNLGPTPSQEDFENLTNEILDDLLGNGESTVSLTTEEIAGDIEHGVTAGIMVLGLAIVFSCFDDIAGAMAREREKGTMHRLFLTPMNRISFFLGKTIASVILTSLRATVLLLMYLYLLGGVMKGSIVLFYLIAIMIAILTISLGFVISARNISSRGVIILEIAILVPLIFFTGLIVPKELMPPLAKSFVDYLPYWYGNDALRRVALLGQGLEYINFDLMVLGVSSIILFAIAAILMKRNM